MINRRDVLKFSLGSLFFPFELCKKSNKVTITCCTKIRNMFDSNGNVNPDNLIHNESRITVIVKNIDGETEYHTQYYNNVPKAIEDYHKISDQFKKHSDYYDVEVYPNEYYLQYSESDVSNIIKGVTDAVC